MPKVNLFENVENPEEAIDIAEKIEKLSHDFPLVVIAIENITSGYERHTSLFQNIIGKGKNFAYRRHRKGNQSAVPNPSKERMQELSTCFDTIQGLCKCLNPMTNMQLIYTTTWANSSRTCRRNCKTCGYFVNSTAIPI
jgi:hypothetical protein